VGRNKNKLQKRRLYAYSGIQSSQIFGDDRALSHHFAGGLLTKPQETGFRFKKGFYHKRRLPNIFVRRCNMKKLLPILSLCLVLIPGFTYAQGKKAQIETVTVEQGEPFSLVTAADTNPCLHEARGAVTDELGPLVIAQQKTIKPKSKNHQKAY
jgi:hypothetical protein